MEERRKRIEEIVNVLQKYAKISIDYKAIEKLNGRPD